MLSRGGKIFTQSLAEDIWKLLSHTRNAICPVQTISVMSEETNCSNDVLLIVYSTSFLNALPETKVANRDPFSCFCQPNHETDDFNGAYVTYVSLFSSRRRSVKGNSSTDGRGVLACTVCQEYSTIKSKSIKRYVAGC